MAQVEGMVEAAAAQWTVLRPTGFAKNTLGSADGVRSGVVQGPYGEAARSLIDERDIAAVAARALVEDGHGDRRYVISGPSTLTQSEQVRILGEAVGHPVRWEEVSPAAARPGLVAAFGDPGFANASLAVWAGFVSRPETVTSTVEDVTGTPARTFQRWAVDNSAGFA